MKISAPYLSACTLAFALALSVDATLAAGPASTVSTPDVEKGERSIEFKAGTLDRRRDGRDNEAQFGFGYGVSDVWATALTAEYAREDGSGTRLDAIEWKNTFQLTEADKFPLEVGLLTELDWFKDRSDGYELKIGPLLQKKIAGWQFNANLFATRQFDADASTPTGLEYEWQVKYRWKPVLHVGLQGFGEVGEWDDWASRREQTHQFGPVVSGDIALTDQEEIGYMVAYLTDRSSRARNSGFRLELEYKF
jgi:hypothetical protein